MRQLFACLISIAAWAAAAAAQSTVSVTVSRVTVPPGSTAQIQFFLAKPQALASGELVIDLDPSVFGSVTAATAFSATGDAAGYATVNGLHAGVNFSSQSAGIGQIAGGPIVTVTATILPNATPGSSASVTATPGSSPWKDGKGGSYAVSIGTGTVTIGGTLSISGVQPLTGPLPAGSVVHIDGTGFTAATAVDIQAVAISSTSFVSPTRIDVTLAGPAELTGKRVRLTNPDGAQVAFYPAWLGPPVSTGSGDPFANALPILPLGAYAQATYGAIPINSGWLVLQNPNANPVDVAIENPVPAQLRIPAGGYSYQNLATLGLQLEIGWRVLASAPIRMLTLTAYNDVYGQPPALIITASPLIPLNLGPLIVGPERYQDFGLQGGHDDPDLEAARGFGLLLQNVCANR